MSQANIDLGIFQETKLTKCIYTGDLSGFKVVSTEAPSEHSVAVIVFYSTSDHFLVEVFQIHGENVVRFQLASGYMRWFIVVCYMAPDYASTIDDAVTAIGKLNWGAALLVVGNFNTNLDLLEVRERNEVIAAALVEEGLEDMSGHFLPRHKPWLKDGLTWVMHQGGREV